MGYETYSDKVLKILTNSPGIVLYRDDIAEDTGLTLEQVTTGMLRVMKTDFSKYIDVAVRGRAWAYHPNRAAVVESPTRKVRVVPVEETVAPAPAPKDDKPKVTPVGDSFERVGKSDNGDVVVKDMKGTLYKVVKLL